jgi:regulation of enolase protein 1 (concanavalin A-like superfamily)
MSGKLMYFFSFLFIFSFVGVATAQEIDPNLVCWLTFDEGTGIYAEDATGNDNFGELFNGPVWVEEGRIGGALDLDGTNDYVNCGNGPTLNITSQITLAVWVKPRTAGNGAHQSIILKGDNSYAIKFHQWGNIEFFIYANNGWRTCTLPIGDTAAFNNNWHHLAGTYDGRNFNLYLEGEHRATAIYVGAIATNATNVNMGRDADGGGRRYLNGTIDDARIYNRAISAAEIRRLANPEKASLPAPANNGIISQSEVTLQWETGVNAVSHDVYFGETFADVNSATPATDVIYKGRQSQNMYPDTSALPVELGTTYYWRIDEIDSAGNINIGDIWSFTVQPLTAYNPNPSIEAKYIDLDADLLWSPGFKAQSHDVYFGTSPTAITNATTSSAEFKGNQTAATYALPPLEYDMLYYWRIDEQNTDGTVSKGDIWRFRTLPSTPITDPALVGWWKLDDDSGTIVLDWSGQGNHGTIVGDPQWILGYDDGALSLDGFDDCVNCGDPNSFNITNVISILAWIKANSAGNGANQSYVMKGNSGAEGYGLRHSATNDLQFRTANGINVQTPVNSSFNGVWHHLAGTYDRSQLMLYVDGELQANISAAGDISTSSYNLNIGREAVGNRYLYDGAIDDVRVYSRALTEDEIKQIIKGDPTLARNPSPSNGSTLDIEQFMSLSWTPGEKASQHGVYLGNDALDVEYADASNTEGIYRGVQDANSYVPPEGLQPGQTYYWRIDEINNDATVSKGRVWAFTVLPYLIVDNFEGYDDADNRIYYAWEDYFANNTGMTVGHFDPPFAERTIVHSGRQSMYMTYDNDGTVNEGTDYEQSGTLLYSETQRSWEAAQDWARKGTNSLTLWFRGVPASVGSFTAGPPIVMTAAGADIWAATDQFHFAYKQLSGNGSITARVISMTNTNAAAKAGIMIRESLEPGAAHATVDIQPINEVQLIYRSSAGATSVSVGQGDVSAPVWVRLTRSGNTFTGEYSIDGTNWQTLDLPIITMGLDVYIGLIVCSHDINATCTAEFSNVTISGAATGDWQSQDIGIESNVADQLYVMLQDSANNSAMVKHPDPAATTFSTWTQWSIPLTDFSGVDMQAVKKMAVGVGDRTNPQAGGSGTLYIDDIGLNLPDSEQ